MTTYLHRLPVETKKPSNLCEVCFKPFNLVNIEMHLEAGCAAEIYARYNIKPLKTANFKREKKNKKIKSKRNASNNQFKKC